MTTLRTTRFRTFAPVAGAALAVASAGAVAVSPSASAAPAPTSCTTTGRLTVCDYTEQGEYQLFIPQGVSRVAVLAIGGAGGKSVSAAGGFGQQVVDYLEVSEGDFLFANVGGAATNASCADERVECSAGYGEGGFSSSGGGGGGASDVRTISASQPGSRDSRHIVAGGGGGAGGSGTAQAGGAGGNAGAAGAPGGGGLLNGGGAPGTQTAAGVGGAPNGTDGFLDKAGSSLSNGGAGGGGYFGGGSGAYSGVVSPRTVVGAEGGGGGGGGSSLVAHSTASVTTATQRAGRVQLRYSVDDRTAPHIDLMVGGTVVPATSSAGAIVDYTATATDDVDGADPVSCTPPSGTYFPIGTTTISCEAFDVSGNRGTASATVQVVDVASPALHLPARIDVPATNRTGAVVTYTATAEDVVDGPVTPECRPPSGSLFVIGSTEVICTARDAAGNLTTGSFTVSVADRTAPTLTVPENMTVEATRARRSISAIRGLSDG
jgi:glycine rich protein/HYR domain-containing protein